MYTKVLKITPYFLMLLGCFTACSPNKDIVIVDDAPEIKVDNSLSGSTTKPNLGIATASATGTIMGSFGSNPAILSFLVRVDKKYPIGETITYNGDSPCVRLPKAGTYRNMIRVQCHLPLSDRPESSLNMRISFSYRAYQHDEDVSLFYTGLISHGPPLPCNGTNVPVYVITDCQIFE